jgi:CRISPR-associated endonuclease/helicase Cas3
VADVGPPACSAFTSRVLGVVEMNDSGYLAHSANEAGAVESLHEHIACVTRRAAKFADAFGASEEAVLAGMLHDLGKYGELFQQRLRGKGRGIDHWSAGAWTAIRKHRSIAAAAVIQGHHVGLQKIDKDSLCGLDPNRLANHHPLGMRLSEPDVDLLCARMRAEVGEPAAPVASLYGLDFQETTAAMLDVRLLFSALVDADFLETEGHFQGKADGQKVYRREGPALNALAALAILDAHVNSLAQQTRSSAKVAAIRSDLQRACRAAAQQDPGLFTLSAPTGSGKTLAMLAFALAHAAQHNLRRVVIVIPYLSIIEQTATTYRELFRPHFGDHYILEHHSLAGTRPEPAIAGEADADNEDEARCTARLLAENWDAPIVVTTSVQFLESLFANRPSACRKLHRLAESVILFDEVQTLPPHLAPATLATLSHLSARYRTSVVFATATQPAFSCLERQVRDLGGPGWQPSEIVAPALDLFGRAKRTHVNWPNLARPTPWETIADSLAKAPRGQALCIVNLKRHALILLKTLKDQGSDALFHLSTSMCPAHRTVVLDEVKARLKAGQSCRLVATQCVEAGVDVDFPVVYRAFGPLEAVAQAAGRCNRSGCMPEPELGEVHVFLPDEPDETRAYPPGIYGQAAGITRMLLQERGSQGPSIDDPNIDDPKVFDAYYRKFYDVTNVADISQGRAGELAEAIRRQDFVRVAELYRLIPKDAINVLVPYDLPAYEELAEVRNSRLTGDWIRKARPYTVGLYRPKPGLPIWLEAVPVARGRAAEDWFIYLCLGNKSDYDPTLGLCPADMGALIG